MLSKTELQLFRNNLLTWYGAHRRDLPWRRSRDPYAIWLSEVMLQQTRVAAVIPYFERFLSRFPNVTSLAQAPESELLSNWAGLGYYYRARNLQKAAREIDAASAFPSTYDEIRRLPGIGDYTAAAVASIAFDLPHPVVDGNVYRVLSRVFNDRTNIVSTGARKHFTRLAEIVLERDRPGEFNQAMMELGATVCLPRSPHCLICPISPVCKARASGVQDSLPVKIKSGRTVEEQRTVFWIERGGKLLVWQRPPCAHLMPGFWELPEREHIPYAAEERSLGSFRHGITFHNYRFVVLETSVAEAPAKCEWVNFAGLDELPLSTVLKKARKLVTIFRSKNRAASDKVLTPSP